MLALAGAGAVGASVADMLRGGSVHIFSVDAATGEVFECLWTLRNGWRSLNLTENFGIPAGMGGNVGGNGGKILAGTGFLSGAESIVFMSRDLPGHLIWAQKLYVDLDVERRPEHEKYEKMSWKVVDVTEATSMCTQQQAQQQQQQPVAGGDLLPPPAVAEGKRERSNSSDSSDARRRDGRVNGGGGEGGENQTSPTMLFDEDGPASADSSSARVAAAAAAAGEDDGIPFDAEHRHGHGMDPLPDTVTYWVNSFGGLDSHYIHFLDASGRTHELSLGMLPGARWEHQILSHDLKAPRAFIPMSAGGQSSSHATGSGGETEAAAVGVTAGAAGTASLEDDFRPLDTFQGEERELMRELANTTSMLKQYQMAKALHEAGERAEAPEALPEHVSADYVEDLRKKLDRVRADIREAEIASAPANFLEFGMSVLDVHNSVAALPSVASPITAEPAEPLHERRRARVLQPVLAANAGFGGSEYLSYSPESGGICLLRYGTGWYKTEKEEGDNEDSDGQSAEDDMDDDAFTPPQGWLDWGGQALGKAAKLVGSTVSRVASFGEASMKSWTVTLIHEHCSDFAGDEGKRRLHDMEPLTLLASTQTATGAQLIFFADRHQHLHELRWTQKHRNTWRHFDLTAAYGLPLVQRSCGVCVCDATSLQGQIVLLYFVDTDRKLHELRQYSIPLPGTRSSQDDLTSVGEDANPWLHTRLCNDGYSRVEIPAVSRLCSAQAVPLSRSVGATVVYFIDSGTHNLQELTLQWRLVKPPLDDETSMEFMYLPHLLDLTATVADFPVPSSSGVAVYTRGVMQAFTAQAGVILNRTMKYVKMIPGVSGAAGSEIQALDGDADEDQIEPYDSDGSGDESDTRSVVSGSTTRTVSTPKTGKTGSYSIMTHRNARTAGSPHVQKEVLLKQKYQQAVSRTRELKGVNDDLRAEIVKLQAEHDEASVVRQEEITMKLESLQEQLKSSEQRHRQHEQELSEAKAAQDRHRADMERERREHQELKAKYEEAAEEARARARDEAEVRKALEEKEVQIAEAEGSHEQEVTSLTGERDDLLRRQKELEIELQRAQAELGKYGWMTPEQYKAIHSRPGTAPPSGAAGGKDEAVDDNGAAAADEEEKGMMLSSLGDDDCIICWGEYGTGTERLQPCGHKQICAHCIAETMKEHGQKCPSCRKAVMNIVHEEADAN